MSFDSLEDVNYLAVAVAAIAWFVIGAVWYAPRVFGGALYERRPRPGAWFGVTGIFNLLGYLVVAVIFTVWD